MYADDEGAEVAEDIVSMMVPDDCDGLFLRGVEAGVAVAGTDDVEVMVRQLLTDTDMLLSPLVITAGDNTNYPTADADIDLDQPRLERGDFLCIDVVSGADDALGLKVTLVLTL